MFYTSPRSPDVLTYIPDRHVLRIRSLYDLARWESSVAKDMTMEVKQDVFRFAHTDNYPPYLANIPADDQKNLFQIFNWNALIQTALDIFLPVILYPDWIKDLAPDALKDKTMQSLIDRNRRLHSDAQQNMYFQPNIGHRDDWYTDAVFGQQQFTGPNPTSITAATPEWIGRFNLVAQSQNRADVVTLIKSSPANSFFIQDYSFFRSVIGASPTAELMTEDRYACASVVLFHLEPKGKLHPLAIVTDFKGSMATSVTIFNRRINSASPIAEAGDWPWRYAKMCAQVSDWAHHEVAVHLVNTHLVEEAVIVAVHRTIDPTHVVFKLLEPHWNITLSLNAAARSTLVPRVIVNIVGFTPTQAYALVKGAYKRFDWTGSYVPNDLKRRGFPVADLNKPKFHNYGYARNIIRMWEILRKFVATVLKASYVGGDAQVAADRYISAFCAEMRSPDGADLPSFPDVKTLDQLIDMVTMCIHIASPQHTAVNYLQQYYQTFVPNKPAALYTPLPKTFDELKKITEADVIAALPVDHPKDWLLQAQLPYLLSFQPAESSTILRYAQDAQWLYFGNQVIRDAAKVFKKDLEGFIGVVEKLSKELDDQKTPYTVLDPQVTASSILI